MKFLLGTAFFLLTHWAVGQKELPYIVEEETYGRIEVENLYAMLPAEGGGFLLGGLILIAETNDFFGNADFIVLQVDENGEKEWEWRYGGTDDDVLFDIVKSDGGYLLGGYSKSGDEDIVSGNRGRSDFWVVKVDSDGLLEWEKSFGGTGEESIYSIVSTGDGGYLLGGESSSKDGLVQTPLETDQSFWTTRIDADGAFLWEHSYAAKASNGIRSIAAIADGFLLGGYASSGNGFGQSDYYVVQVNSEGTVQWERTYGGTKEDFLTVVLPLDGGFILGGHSGSSDGDRSGDNYGENDLWIIKIDELGNQEWEQAYGGSENETLTAIHVVNDGYILCGMTDSDDGLVLSGNKGQTDIWIVKIDKEGHLLWETTLGGSSYDYGYAIESHPDGGWMVGGYTGSNDQDVSNNHGYNDFWMVHLKTNQVPEIADQTVYLETDAFGITAISIEAEDADSDDLVYAIVEGNDEELFAINSEGLLEVLYALDEAKSRYDLKVEVSDGKHSSLASVIVYVGEVLGLEMRNSFIHIYPNPADHYVYIDNQKARVSEAQFIDSGGRLTSMVTLQPGLNRIVLTREKGLCWIRIIDQGQVMHLEKLIRTR